MASRMYYINGLEYSRALRPFLQNNGRGVPIPGFVNPSPNAEAYELGKKEKLNVVYDGQNGFLIDAGRTRQIERLERKIISEAKTRLVQIGMQISSGGNGQSG